MSTFKIREISEIALLAAFIAVSGAFKLPSFIPGSEFQLSAPIAVAICGVFGTEKEQMKFLAVFWPLPAVYSWVRKLFSTSLLQCFFE